jgi:hypothetical protein
MEHAFPMSRLLPPHFFWLISFYTLSATGAEQKLVLVTSAQSPISKLTTVETRRLYLGVPFQVNGRAITPLRNTSDPRLQEVFMQHVMYMATETYERQILNRVFRTGGQRPPTYSEPHELIQALNGNPLAISYLWHETALATPGLKIVGE